jgi:hypothetical protein
MDKEKPFVVVNSHKVSDTHVTITKDKMVTINSKSYFWHHVIVWLLLISSVILVVYLSREPEVIVSNNLSDLKFPDEPKVIEPSPVNVKSIVLNARLDVEKAKSEMLSNELKLRDNMKEPYTVAERIYRLNLYYSENLRKLDSNQIREIKSEREILINQYRAISVELKEQNDIIAELYKEMKGN